MKLQKLTWPMLVLFCSLLLQWSCSYAERGDTGMIAASRSAESDNASLQAYWDGANKEIRILFNTPVGLVEASVVGINQEVIYQGALNSEVSDQVISLRQIPAGEYTLALVDTENKVTTLRFAIDE